MEYYTEPENIKKSKIQIEEGYANDDLEVFGSADNVEGSQQTDAEVDVLEDVICTDQI